MRDVVIIPPTLETSLKTGLYQLSSATKFINKFSAKTNWRKINDHRCFSLLILSRVILNPVAAKHIVNPLIQ